MHPQSHLSYLEKLVHVYILLTNIYFVGDTSCEPWHFLFLHRIKLYVLVEITCFSGQSFKTLNPKYGVRFLQKSQFFL